ncbi:MAG: 4a-hydroxytetrahydrobiopterin dehydratase [Chloroflexi bacterium]|nr:MAG: 4a-hydroxytetrahydrobiopterin dehydratase [Chloroflexota bacterium]
MPKVQPLSEAEIESQLATVPGWAVVGGKLHREFKFKDFVGAFGFMTKVALLAEAANHHPEWRNVYNQVTIDLVTHAAGAALSQRDFALAQAINRLAIS